MKTYTLLFILLLASCTALLAQDVDISGRWEGYLDQSAAASKIEGYQIYWEKGVWKKGVKTHDLRLTFNYDKRKGYYTGEYYINDAIKKAHYGRFAIKATYKNGKVKYETTKRIFEVKNSLNLGFCYSEATLKWYVKGDYEYLEGPWRGWNDKRRACAAAHIRLRRRRRTPPPVEVEVKDTVPAPVVVEPDPPVVNSPTEVDPPPVNSPVIPPADYTTRKDITKDQLHINKDSIDIAIWDDNRADGDIITLLYNGEVLIKEYTLRKQPRRFRVKLKSGKNIITLIAHNLGEIPPNTAAVKIEREEGYKHVVLESDMNKSESIIIIKQ